MLDQASEERTHLVDGKPQGTDFTRAGEEPRSVKSFAEAELAHWEVVTQWSKDGDGVVAVRGKRSPSEALARELAHSGSQGSAAPVDTRPRD